MNEFLFSVNKSEHKKKEFKIAYCKTCIADLKQRIEHHRRKLLRYKRKYLRAKQNNNTGEKLKFRKRYNDRMGYIKGCKLKMKTYIEELNKLKGKNHAEN